MTTTYLTVNGRVLQQAKNGVTHRLITDPQGSVIATLDDAGNVANKTNYWPFGSGVSSVTNLGYLGGVQMYTDLLGVYIKRTYYLPKLSSFVTNDSNKFNANRLFQIHIQPIPLPFPLPVPTPIVEIVIIRSEPNPCEYCHGDYWSYYDSNPISLGYGNWCGQGRPGLGKCEVKNVQYINPRHPCCKVVDGPDSCCRDHDFNQGNWLIWGDHGCAHCRLLSCAKRVDCSQCPTPVTCEIARNALIYIMTGLCKAERIRPRCWFV